MPVHGLAIDGLDVLGKELRDVLVGGPIHRHTEFIAVGLLKTGAQVLALEPVVAEPVQVGELLVRQLVELAVRAGGEAFADEVVHVQGGQGHRRALPRHEVRQRHHVAVAGVGADQVGVVDVGVIDVLPGLHLGLQLLDDVAFLDQIVGDLEPGDLGEGLGKHLGLVGVGGERLGHHADLKVSIGRRGLGEPSQFRQLLITT